MATNPPAGRKTSGEAPVEKMSYEQARDELVTVVARLEAGGETLEGSLALWERGEQLAARCQQWLDGARARLDAARTPDGGAEAEGDGGSGPGSDAGSDSAAEGDAGSDSAAEGDAGSDSAAEGDAGSGSDSHAGSYDLSETDLGEPPTPPRTDAK